MSDISLTDYSSLYTSADYSQAKSSMLSDKVSNTDYSQASDEELMDACKAFEAYFVEQIMKEAEEMVHISDDDGDAYSSSVMDYAMDGLMEEYSQMVSDQGSLGLAEKLYEQMKRNYNV
ncbi:MAG: hypothetical protein K6G40_01900 [Eubacterium sp.]|nr:hypothetical protein [Eubacterium sp.]